MANWMRSTPAETQKRLELVPDARSHDQRAIELAPVRVPEAHAMLGSTYLLTDEDSAAGIQSLEHARRLLPGEVSLLLPLAKLYRARGPTRRRARGGAARGALVAR